MPTDRALCANPMHESRKAVAKVAFPDAQFVDTTACHECATWQLETALDFGHAVLVEPITEEEATGSAETGTTIALDLACGHTAYVPQEAAHVPIVLCGECRRAQKVMRDG